MAHRSRPSIGDCRDRCPSSVRLHGARAPLPRESSGDQNNRPVRSTSERTGLSRRYCEAASPRAYLLPLFLAPAFLVERLADDLALVEREIFLAPLFFATLVAISVAPLCRAPGSFACFPLG